MFEIDRNSKRSLVDQVCRHICDRIANRRLVAGAKLPSVRALSQTLGVSPYTVSSAYENLVAQNMIESRKGSGYFVLPDCGSDEGSHADNDTILNAARNALYTGQYQWPVSSGYLPPEWLEEAVPSTVTGRLIRSTLSISEPASPQGNPELRQLIEKKLRDFQLFTPASHIVLTNGVTHAMSLIRKVLVKQGDCVVVEQPGYQCFRMRQQLGQDIEFKTVMRGKDGPDLNALEELVDTYRPKLFFTQTLLHNPTGGNTSPANCYRLLSLAEKYNFYIVEDDIFGFLSPQSSARLASMDGFQRVFYVSSFSKILSPAMRVGYVVTPSAFVSALIDEKISSVLSGSSLEETIITYTLESGRFKRHIEHLKLRIMQERAKAKDWLVSAGMTIEDKSFDGFFLWAKLPATVNPEALVAEAKAAGIFLAAGSLFDASGHSDHCLRLNVAYCNSPEFKQFMIRLLSAG